jgi:two-component system, cell cycle sensor histidine kinase and response regulator CckA
MTVLMPVFNITTQSLRRGDEYKVFDPYFSTKRRGSQKGMGLGLTICHSIIQKHGGTIKLSSKRGEGTTVIFRLPASEAPFENISATGDIIPGKSRILVMDDETGMRKMTGAILERLGYEVTLAENGEKAIECYQAAKKNGRPLDAVILDLTIRGGMGGVETLRALLIIDPEVKALISSGYSEDPVMQNYPHYGFKGALVKPFYINELSEVLSGVLQIS